MKRAINVVVFLLLTFSYTNAQFDKYRLDTIVAEDISATGQKRKKELNTYMYDEQGTLSIQENYKGSRTSNKWIKSTRSSFIKLPCGKVYTSKYDKASKANDDWEDVYKYDYHIDREGYPDVITTQEFNKNEWVVRHRDSITFDKEVKEWNRIIRDIYFSKLKRWLRINKKEQFFNSEGNRILYKGSVRENREWNLRESIQSTYDAGGRLIEILDLNISSDGQSGTKRVADYDVNGNLNHWTIFVWKDSIWKRKQKLEYSYDSYGRVKRELLYEWANSKWARYSKIENTWGDPSINLDSLIVPHFYPNKYQLLNTYSYKWKDGEFVVNNIKRYLYSKVLRTKTKDVKRAAIAVYPLPALDYVVFEGEELTANFVLDLYNSSGMKCLHQKVKRGHRVDVSKLPKGVLFYSILQDHNEPITGKIIHE